jgi:hypothetical protein
MDRTRRALPIAALAGAAAATLAARPAAACDPDAMDAHLTAVCDGALAPARAALEAALPHATPEERMAMQRALTVAGTTCSTGDPVAGARIAANLARIAGRIEGRAGLAPGELDALA